MRLRQPGERGGGGLIFSLAAVPGVPGAVRPEAPRLATRRSRRQTVAPSAVNFVEAGPAAGPGPGTCPAGRRTPTVSRTAADHARYSRSRDSTTRSLKTSASKSPHSPRKTVPGSGGAQSSGKPSCAGHLSRHPGAEFAARLVFPALPLSVTSTRGEACPAGGRAGVTCAASGSPPGDSGMFRRWRLTPRRVRAPWPPRPAGRRRPACGRAQRVPAVLLDRVRRKRYGLGGRYRGATACPGAAAALSRSRSVIGSPGAVSGRYATPPFQLRQPGELSVRAVRRGHQDLPGLAEQGAGPARSPRSASTVAAA